MNLRARLGAVALVLTLTACGNAGYDLSAGVYRGDEKAEHGQRVLRVADTNGMPSAFLRYGMRRGHFAAENLSIDFTPSGGGTTVIPLLLNGELDIAGSAAVAGMQAVDKGLPVKIIAPGTSASDSARDDFASILVRENSQLRKVPDLSGKRVAVNTLHSISDMVIAGLMSKRGGDFSSVQFVEMPFPDMIVALQQGNVDAAYIIEPFSTIGRSQGLREIVQPYAALLPRLQVGCYIAATERIQQDPATIAAFQRALRATAEDVTADRAAFRKALPHVSNLKPELAKKVRLPQWKAASDRGSLELSGRIMRRIGYLDNDFDYGGSVVG